MKDQTHEEPRIVAAAERQMRAWVHSQEVQDQAVSRRFDQPKKVQFGPYLTISREAGAGGSEIARRIGELLTWDVLDKNLLEHIATRLNTSPGMIERLDETQSNWAYDLMASWLDREMVGHETYLRHLEGIMLAAARRGNVVLVGRGAGFLLPREGGLAVRIVASEEYRIERTMRLESLTHAAAKDFVRELERGRSEFVDRHFHRNIADPHLYDLVLNVGRLGMEVAIELILAALKPLR
jgi:cytidylate kinase